MVSEEPSPAILAIVFVEGNAHENIEDPVLFDIKTCISGNLIYLKICILDM